MKFIMTSCLFIKFRSNAMTMKIYFYFTLIWKHSCRQRLIQNHFYFTLIDSLPKREDWPSIFMKTEMPWPIHSEIIQSKVLLNPFVTNLFMKNSSFYYYVNFLPFSISSIGKRRKWSEFKICDAIVCHI